jgi:hypothetical protein
MSDSERLAAARKFFWEQVGDNIVDPATVERQIRKLAEALPPFTRMAAPNRKEDGKMTGYDRWPPDGICRSCGEELSLNATGQCFDCFLQKRGLSTSNAYAEEAEALEEWESALALVGSRAPTPGGKP